MIPSPPLPQFGGKQIFVVGGDQPLPLALRHSLEVEGYVIQESADVSELLHNSKLVGFHLVILSVGMKNPDLFTLCREIRKTSAIPLVALAEESSELDEAMFFAAGGDEFLMKSVTPRIFTLRVAALIRRGVASNSQSSETIEGGGLVLNLNTRKVLFDDVEVDVTRTEFDLLRLLMERPHKVFTREEVIAAIGGAGDFANDHFLDTHASRLRLKIKAAGGPKVITAVRGVGYRLISSQGRSDGGGLE
jgi:DNA-binding response OmpR family regulator